ncbi:MAG: response regulator transcription factor [Candidatus Riflebacteria bacterium]|nr:response regulator transcription factor [Candidatus Riflebacteria bacterium]
MEYKILIADDHRIFREGLKTLFEKQTNFKVVGEASDGLLAVELAAKTSPDLVIMDISMPGLNGIEAAKMILQKKPDIHIIALSMHSDRRFVTEALKSGIRGYLLKDSAFEELNIAVRTVLNKKTFLSSTITEIVVKDFLHQTSEKSTSAFIDLTPREREILQQLAEGKTTKEIAKSFSISIKTVETHRKQIMDKLNLHSIAELTKYAIREGLTSL